eukprot:146928-Alexandrium_andersonii.AAC.1
MESGGMRGWLPPQLLRCPGAPRGIVNGSTRGSGRPSCRRGHESMRGATTGWKWRLGDRWRGVPEHP